MTGNSGGGGGGGGGSAPAYTGAGRGQLPNVRWRAVEMDEVRGHERFVGLPPPDCLRLDTPESYRYARQDSEAWAAAHSGVLTTAYAKAALGLCEPAAAKQLGIPKGQAGHGQLQHAYRHLLSPAGHALPRAGLGPGSRAGQGDETERHNCAAVEAYNSSRDLQRLLQRAAATSTNGNSNSSNAAPESAGFGGGGPAAGLEGNGKKKKKKKKQKGGSQQQQQHGQLPADEQLLRARARATAAGGISRVRCAWGSAQEASTLSALLSLLPRARLHESGLYIADASMLQRRYGYGPGTLPPLGASPDALLYYGPSGGGDGGGGGAIGRSYSSRSSLTSSANGSRGSISTNGSVGGVALPPPPPLQQVMQAPSSGGAAAAAAFGCVACGAGAGPVAAGGVPGATAAAAAPGGGGGAAPRTAPTRSAAAPGAGAGAAAAGGRAGQGAGAGDGSVDGLQRLLQDIDLYSPRGRCQQQQQEHQEEEGRTDGSGGGGSSCATANGSSSSSTLGSTSASSSSTAAAAATAAAEAAAGERYTCGCIAPRGLEVVEVKNTAPFASCERYTAGGRLRHEFVVSDRGPQQQVRPYWVPQLQMHMLATGATSALLVSRSATKGITVFRCVRDEQYIADMLAVLSHLYTRHVLPRVPPPPSPYSRMPAYQRLVARTRALAREAPMVAAFPDAHAHAPATDLRLMLD